ncbi:MAG: DNA-formamidopyrimidine glycosylase family protein [Desulfobacterales bacterium]
MPELPDVEILRQYLAATALHQRIDQVRVGEEKNRQVLEGISPQQLGQAVKGRSFEDTARHGKYCFAELSGGRHLAFHFGMTGWLRYYQRDPDDLSHVRVRFDFSSGYHLAFVNTRLLGSLALVADPRSFIAEKNLGPDALDDLSETYFQELMDNSNAKIKALLTNQQKIAGIGNVYADEILFQARVHPTVPANLLGRGERRRLFKALVQVLQDALQARADPQQMPDGSLLPIRKQGETCPRCSAALKKIPFQGRSAYLCPTCQKA